jgi:hypothetical protein
MLPLVTQPTVILIFKSDHLLRAGQPDGPNSDKYPSQMMVGKNTGMRQNPSSATTLITIAPFWFNRSRSGTAHGCCPNLLAKKHDCGHEEVGVTRKRSATQCGDGTKSDTLRCGGILELGSHRPFPVPTKIRFLNRSLHAQSRHRAN